MPLKLDMIRNLLIALLLMVTGVFGEYRYHVVEEIAAAVHYSPASSILDLPERQSTNARAQLTNTDSPTDKKSVDFQVFWEVWEVLEQDYLETDKIDAQKMVDGAIGGMTAALDDPYTAYLPPKAFERSGQELAGAFYGVGIELGYREGILAVVAPLAGTPADATDVEAGDLIIRVKDPQKNLDEDSSQWSLDEAVEHIRGPIKTPVTLTLVREGRAEPFDVTITRDEIVVQSAQVEFVEHDGKRVAHIKLSRFGERTDQEWEDVVTKILVEQPHLDGILLDMRNNPGGLFDGAIQVASEFIKDGVIVSQQGKFSQQEFKARGGARLTRLPLVVLVNKGSASASEIVAGALRDRLQSKLVGEKTFGKGTVQDRRDVSNGGGVHITIARWLLPGGSWIHHEGIPVDVEIKDNAETPEDEVVFEGIKVISQ